MKDRFDGSSEQPGDPEGQRQAGVIAACLEGVDGLAGHLELVGQGALAPTVVLAQRLEVVPQRFRPTTPAPAAQPSIPAPKVIQPTTGSARPAMPRKPTVMDVIMAVAKPMARP